MEPKKFSPLYVAQLKLNHLFALNKTTIEIALPQKGTLGSLTDAAFSQLEQVNAELDRRLNRPLGSLITPELKQLDAKRDHLLGEIKRNIKTASKSSDTVKSDAGKVLLHFLTPYWTIENQALNTESGLIGEITGRYNSDPTLIAGAAAIGIDALWNELSGVNNSFETLYYERNTELASKDDPAGKFRKDAVKSYENFCSLVEQSVNLTPTDALNTLFDRMNNLRKTYHALVPKKKGEDGNV
ncbi:MAG: DUF6261 family protein [Candidatus Symbiothrix sp.]|jgi:hypothetical protein|nr:DUF6261 family protein [Candidatus Symbiothrix sp.]